MGRYSVLVFLLSVSTSWYFSDQETSGNLLHLPGHHNEFDPVGALSFCEVCLHHSSLHKLLTTDIGSDWKFDYSIAPKFDDCQHCLLAWLQSNASFAPSRENSFSLDACLAGKLRSHMIFDAFWNDILTDVFCARFVAVWKHSAYLSQRLRKSSQLAQDVSRGNGKNLDDLVWQKLVTFSKPCPILCFVEAVSLLQGDGSFGRLIFAFGVLGTIVMEMHFADEAYCRLASMLAVGLVTQGNAAAMCVAYSCPSHGEDGGMF